MKRILIFILTVLLLTNLLACQSIPKDTTQSHPHPSDIATVTISPPTISSDLSTDIETVTPTISPDLSTDTKPITPTISPEPSTDISTDISTFEPSETEPEDNEFVLISDYVPTAKIELAYATVNNFTGIRIYDFTDAYLRYGTVKKLMKIAEALEKEGVGLIIWDAFRPVSAQKVLYECYPDPTFVSHPVTGKRAHCRGNTVDVTLYDLENGKELSMPSEFDDFTSAADRDYSGCSSDVAKNARLLEDTFVKYEFTPYYNEWWHFSDTIDYPVDEDFEPTVPKIWVANCNEFINLRNYPGGKTLAKIPKGEAFEIKKWDGQQALVTYQGITGYVHTAYIKPADSDYFKNILQIVAPTDTYSYEQMLSDLDALQKQYPDTVHLTSIGKSELGAHDPCPADRRS